MNLHKLIRRVAPKSISARLALGSAILVMAALVMASVSTGIVLSRFIRGQIDQRLDIQIGAVATALSLQGSDTGNLRLTDVPPFDRVLDGWYWTAAVDGRVYRSTSLVGGDIQTRTPDGWWERRGPPRHDGRPDPFNGVGPHGEPLYMRVQMVPTAGGWATITASAPAHALTRPLRDALMPVIIAMLVLGFMLAVASFLQLRLGLRPLGRLQKDLADVRAGRSETISGGQPSELLPLVTELNSLILQNAEGIRRARGHVSNLGHALNTPLAALSLSLSSGGAAQDAERLKLVGEMQERIRHHLGRARAAALHGPLHPSTNIAPRLSDILDVLGKVHADKGISVTANVAISLAVACEPHDLDEMLGNLLDNAFKWASREVAIEARLDGQFVQMKIFDDGVGIDAEKIEDVLLAGRRIDEVVPGHGFGLPITRELAELYGGSLNLDRAPMGGLQATLRLPVTH